MASKKKKKPEKDDFSVDFSSIKKLFKLKGRPGSTAGQGDFAHSKAASAITIIILIAIAMSFSVYFRNYSTRLPAVEDWAENNVQSFYKSQIVQQVNAQYPNLPQQNRNELVNKEFAKFLESNKKDIDFQVKQTAAEIKKHFQWQLPNGDEQTYLLAIDPYFYYRRTRNLVETGQVYDEIQDGVPIDNKMLAPLGKPLAQPDLHSLTSSRVHKIYQVFKPDVHLMQSFFIMPIIIASLCVIPAFFIGRKKAGLFGGLIAGIMVAIHPAFIGRTTGGFSDTDGYIVLISLLTAWVFLESFEAVSLLRKSLLAAGAGALVGLFAFAWGGWWYMFNFLVAVMVIFILYTIAKILYETRSFKKLFCAQLRNPVLLLLIFVASSAIFVTAFEGFGVFITGPLQPILFTAIKDPVKPDLWPNVYTTVAELNPSSLRGMVRQIGGKFLLLTAFIGVLFTLTRKKLINYRDLSLLGLSALYFLILHSNKVLGYFEAHTMHYLFSLSLPIIIGLLILLLKKDKEVDVKYALMLTIWFVGTIYAATKGVRFTLLLVPAFSIAVGIALGRVHQVISGLMSREFRLNINLARAIMIIVLCLILITPVKTAHAAAKGQVPSMNDAWFNSLQKIDQEAAPDAIINSWWDFGHWFKAIGNRAVTFDGASQNSPMAHWIGKALLSDDEKTTVGILRMLDCGSNLGPQMLIDITNDTVGSIKIINEIILLDKEGARAVLEKTLSKENAAEVLDHTHCEPPENYFITSGDMVGKAGVWGHFGSWDFERAYIYYTARKTPQQTAVEMITAKLGIDQAKAQEYFFQVRSLSSVQEGNTWVSPWPNFATQSMVSCSYTEEENLVLCPVNLNIGTQNNNNIILEGAVINTAEPLESRVMFGIVDRSMNVKVGESEGMPAAVAITEEDGIIRHVFDAPSFNFDLLYDSLRNRMLVVEPLLTKSTFTKLFYLNGRYMPHFDLFHSDTSITGDRILIWKADWDGKQGQELEEWKAKFRPAPPEPEEVPEETE